MRKRVYKFTIILFTIILISSIFSYNALGQSKKDKSKKVDIKRIYGKNRYETASKISYFSFKDGTENVILATGEDFPDSLCAVPLASKLKGPILLTGKSTLNSFSKDEIIRLKAKNIYIIGGTGVISTTVENQLKAMGKNTIRIGGKDRFDTSLKIANAIGNSSTLFLAIGNNYPDALSVAAIASKNVNPILLTTKDKIPPSIEDYLSKTKAKNIFVVGGSGIIKDSSLSKFPDFIRLGGANRYETNSKIINNFSKSINFSNAYITVGTNFPDALAVSLLASITSSPVILTDKVLNNNAKDTIESNISKIDNIIFLGGEQVLPNTLLQNIDYSIKSNALNPLVIPTYDGSNQACHPKVLYFKEGWNGYKYWMTFTPYPFSDNKFENPSLAVSNDGKTWFPPVGVPQPIVPTPPEEGAHNSDPHLVYNPATDTLELWYRYTYNHSEDKIYRVVSKDGENWSSPEIMISLYGSYALSPSIIYENDKYKMWYIDEDYTCVYMESDNGRDWYNEKVVNLNLQNDYVPWHIDVVHTDKGYEMLINMFIRNEYRKNNRILAASVSNDGFSFNTPEIILTPSKGYSAWDNKQIYRSTFVIIDGEYYLYYSAMDKSEIWNIGVIKGPSLDELGDF